MKTKRRHYKLYIISLVTMLLVIIGFASPSQAHWADLAVAEINIGETQTAITLTLPTGLVALADENRDKQLTSVEVEKHQVELANFLRVRVRFTDITKQNPTLQVTSTTPANLQPTSTHTTLQLNYTWQQPPKNLKIHYDLFVPDAPAAHCLATIFHAGKVENVIFNLGNREYSLTPNSKWQFTASFAAVIGALFWGAVHAMSPGHGKTLVGAYLVGSRATAKHAVFLGLTTTITHTIGVFILGLLTLFASRYIVAESLYPWLNLISGVIVIAIGVNLLIRRLRHTHHHHHEHEHHHHHHHHSHHHEHEHHHHHLPPENTPITKHDSWHSLIALGVSGGIVPCPSAMVLLLSAIATGHIGFGLILVLSFSLGLAGVLTAIGLLLVYCKNRFEKLPKTSLYFRFVPIVSAICICLIGVGISLQAFIQTQT
jgi:nickel/cobalt transporter (NicO) family protein